MKHTENIGKSGFRFNERHLSQLPALQLLINLGFEYLPPEQALKARGGRLGNLLLDEILHQQLQERPPINGRMQKLLTNYWQTPLLQSISRHMESFPC